MSFSFAVCRDRIPPGAVVTMATGGGGGGGDGMEDYLSEIDDIEQGKTVTDSGTSQSDDELNKTPDGKSCLYCIACRAAADT